MAFSEDVYFFEFKNQCIGILFTEVFYLIKQKKEYVLCVFMYYVYNSLPNINCHAHVVVSVSYLFFLFLLYTTVVPIG